MAQFARMKMLFNSEGVRVGMMTPREPFVEYNKTNNRKLIRYVSNGVITKYKKSRNDFFEVACFKAAAGDNKRFDVFDDDDDDSDDDAYSSSECDGVLDFQVDNLACFRGLVLDISYRPINVVCWKRAICLEFMEKADVLEYYDQTVNSASGSFYIPAVLRIPHLLQVVRRRRIKRNLSRKNIFFRDNYTCQYCSSGENLTIDHVLPASRGGEWTWENLVTACARCNSRKGQKTLEEAKMKLLKVPKVPKDYDILAIPLTSAAIKSLGMRKGTPEEWRQYLSRSLDS